MTVGGSEDKDSEKEPQGEKCQYHDTCGHIMDNCKTPKSLVKQQGQTLHEKEMAHQT